jgi:hypothetical protein
MSDLKKLEDLSDYLNQMTTEEWRPLFALIDKIKETTKFGELKGGQEIMKGVSLFPYFEPSEIVSEFQDLCYKLSIITVFDWKSWKEGIQWLENDETDYTVFDNVTLCKFLTAIIRNDRFCDGFLISYFKKGIILKILLALKHNIEESKEL